MPDAPHNVTVPRSSIPTRWFQQPIKAPLTYLCTHLAAAHSAAHKTASIPQSTSPWEHDDRWPVRLSLSSRSRSLVHCFSQHSLFQMPQQISRIRDATMLPRSITPPTETRPTTLQDPIGLLLHACRPRIQDLTPRSSTSPSEQDRARVRLSLSSRSRTRACISPL